MSLSRLFQRYFLTISKKTILINLKEVSFMFFENFLKMGVL
jgi:hypothetical protein